MNDPNSCGVTFNLHLRDCGPLSVQVQEVRSSNQPLPDILVVSIGAGVRIQEACLYLEPAQLAKLADVLGSWASALQAQDALPGGGRGDPQQDDDLIDVRGDK